MCEGCVFELLGLAICGGGRQVENHSTSAHGPSRNSLNVCFVPAVRGTADIKALTRERRLRNTRVLELRVPGAQGWARLGNPVSAFAQELC